MERNEKAEPDKYIHTDGKEAYTDPENHLSMGEIELQNSFQIRQYLRPQEEYPKYAELTQQSTLLFGELSQ